MVWSIPQITIRFFAVAVVAGLSLPLSAACSKKLNFAYYETSAEFEKDGTLSDPFMVDLMLGKKILDLSGCDYELKKLNWNRILVLVKAGDIDGTFGVAKSAERAEYGYFSNPYRENLLGMVMRLEDIPKFRPKNLNDIITSNLNIGIRIGVWHGEFFESAYKTNENFRKHVLRAGHDFALIDWVIAKRADIILDDIVPARISIKQKGYSNTLGIHPFAISKTNIHILLSKKSLKISDIKVFNEAIDSLKSTKTYQKFKPLFSVTK